MNKKLLNLFLGLILIAGGAAALAQTKGYLPDLQPAFWAIIFAAISLTSLILYFLSGVQNWGMLFPVGIFGALALLVNQAVNHVDNPAMAAPLFVGLGLPFVVAYLLGRDKNWWAVIPAGIMAFLTFVLLSVGTFGGEMIGAAFLFILAGIFGFIYFTRRMLWAAIVAYCMFVLGLMPLMAMGPRPELAGIIMLFAIALPFLGIYLRAPDEKWWAIIPAGILGTAGLLTAIILLPGLPGPGYDNRLPNTIIYLGIAATFAFIWRRHNKRWAMLFTILAACMAMANLFLQNFQQYWPLLVVLAGFCLLYNALRAKTA